METRKWAPRASSGRRGVSDPDRNGGTAAIGLILFGAARARARSPLPGNPRRAQGLNE